MKRGFRLRSRRIVAPAVVLIVVAAAVALLQSEDRPSWLAWCPSWLGAVIVAVLGVAGTWLLEPWAKRRQADVDREQEDADRLREHLGRYGYLPRIGDHNDYRVRAVLALRVHAAIPLDQSAQQVARMPAPQRPRSLSQRPPAEPRAEEALDPELPTFVDRLERQTGERVRECMRIAGDRGGFLVLIGNSSVGKTRLLFETARQVLPDVCVLAPDLGDGGLVNAFSEANFRLPKLVVWLDELQRFLPGPYFTDEHGRRTPITPAAIRKLLTGPMPVIILGTLWPQHLEELRRPIERADDGRGLEDQYPDAVDILNQIQTQFRLDTFADSERAEAARLAPHDPRLAVAVADPDYNVTEALAGARQIMRRYEEATDLRRAVIHAAVDARRLGVQAPLTDDLLRVAARGYLTSAPANCIWLEAALTDLTSRDRPQDKATAPLIRIEAADDRLLGYTVADYLLQCLTAPTPNHDDFTVGPPPTRNGVPVPVTVWAAAIASLNRPSDLAALGDAARIRGRFRRASHLYRRAIDVGGGHGQARFDLARLLLNMGDRVGARALVPGRDPLPRLTITQPTAGGVDDLVREAWNELANDNRTEAENLYRQLADAGESRYALRQLTDLREQAGDPAGAERLRRFGIDDDTCSAMGGVCPEHGETLTGSANRSWCDVPDCARTWDYDRRGLPCMDPIAETLDMAGSEAALCTGHTVDIISPDHLSQPAS